MLEGTDRKLVGLVAALDAIALGVIITSLIVVHNPGQIVTLAFLVAMIPSLLVFLKLHTDWIKRGSPEAINAARRDLRDEIAARLDQAGWRVETDKMLRTSNPLPAQLLLPMVAHSPNGTALLVYPHSRLEKDSAHFSWIASAEHGTRALQAIEQINATPVIVAPAEDRVIEEFSQLAGEVNVELVAAGPGKPAEQIEGIFGALDALAERVAARQATQTTMALPSELASAEKLDF